MTPRRAVLLTLCALSVSPVPAGDERAETCAASTDRRPTHPDRIADDRLIVKLTAEAASRAEQLPEQALPIGLVEWDVFLGRRGITDGARVIQEHGTPIGDRRLFERVGLDRTYVIRLPRSDTSLVRRLVRELRGQSWVEHAEPSGLFEASRTLPNDPRFPEQWPPDNTGQSGGTPDADWDGPEAWDLETGSSTEIVAILDTGADQDHEDLIDNLIPGFDFGDNDPDPEDSSGHGTQVAGLAAARGNNNTGIAGVCWTCSIMPLKVFPDSGAATVEMLADAIRYAADNGARSINMSLSGGPSWSQVVVDAVDYAAGLGALTLSSAGNFGQYRAEGPAYFPNVVSVGGADHNDARLYDYGDHAELTASTEGALSTDLNDTYSGFGGTSGACPHAAGLASLLRSHDPALHVNELRHLLRLGVDDGVGVPGEDTPGWDRFMGYGRVNAHGSLSMIDGPWLALDRPHYVCAGQLTVAHKDKTAGAAVDVTLSGNIGGDTETVTVSSINANGYYEGTIALAWAGKDGPVTIGDQTLDVTDGETITAAVGGLTATALMDCIKQVCVSSTFQPFVQGDCDQDDAADPGELWSLGLPLLNQQTERMHDAVAAISTTDPNVELVTALATYGDVEPTIQGGVFPDEDGSDDPFRLRVRAGAPANTPLTLEVSLSGLGWEADDAACQLAGNPNQLVLPMNRDLGAAQAGWDFDAGNNQGFGHAMVHGTGDLSECELVLGSWADDWNTAPVSDRSQSGSFSMRLGDGTSYTGSQDAGLATPTFTVDAGGGALAFYMWLHADLSEFNARLADDAMIVEVKRTSEATWSYLPDATYNSNLSATSCPFGNEFPFGVAERINVFAGDGSGTDMTGDTFDRRHELDLAAYAGEAVQVRFRFGAPRVTGGVGTWVDTVSVHGPYTQDAWPGTPPGDLQGSQAGCPTSFDLTWDAVAGADGYRIYRSEADCLDATTRPDVYDTAASPQLNDTGAVAGVRYFYAIEATETATGCPTERACLSGGCSCAAPSDPTGLLLDKDPNGTDLILTWDDPGPIGLGGWNVYRDATPDPAGWGPAHDSNVQDADPGRPGIQYRDVGALQAGPLLHYLITAVDGCGESALR